MRDDFLNYVSKTEIDSWWHEHVITKLCISSTFLWGRLLGFLKWMSVHFGVQSEVKQNFKAIQTFINKHTLNFRSISSKSQYWLCTVRYIEYWMFICFCIHVVEIISTMNSSDLFWISIDHRIIDIVIT